MIKHYRVKETHIHNEEKSYYDISGYGTDALELGVLSGLTKNELFALKAEIEGILTQDMPEPKMDDVVSNIKKLLQPMKERYGC